MSTSPSADALTRTSRKIRVFNSILQYFDRSLAFPTPTQDTGEDRRLWSRYKDQATKGVGDIENIPWPTVGSSAGALHHIGMLPLGVAISQFGYDEAQAFVGRLYRWFKYETSNADTETRDLDEDEKDRLAEWHQVLRMFAQILAVMKEEVLDMANSFEGGGLRCPGPIVALGAQITVRQILFKDALEGPLTVICEAKLAEVPDDDDHPMFDFE